MAWYKRTKEDDAPNEKRSVPAGVFAKCPGCRETLLTADLHLQHDVCPKCEFHFVLSTRDRIKLVIDEGTFEEHDATVESIDPLAFKDSKRYVDRVRAARREVGISDALIAGSGRVEGRPVEAGFFAFEFMAGSMGSVVGE
jgi:acetyl-CoA carboxylase carboxyl transferase subunit beta